MPPILALCLTFAFTGYLFWRERREETNVTAAVWLPLIWLLIIGSRYVSLWLAVFGIYVGGVSLEEGSPVDRLVFLALIVAAVYVLHQRQLRLGELLRNNKWLTIFFVYCFLSVFWSDYPLVSLKRWIKVLGHPIMVLVLFTEPDPIAAIRRVLKRCAYVLIPLSITLIKYYVFIGRGYETWSGGAMNTGVATDKNFLGVLCLLVGFFFFWHFTSTLQRERGVARRNELLLSLAFLAMIAWLMWKANSKTSLVSSAVGLSIVLFLGFRWVNSRAVGLYLVVIVLSLGFAEMAFGLSDVVPRLLGRDATLTDRTNLWKDVLAIPLNPVLGAGFESFWLGDRLTTLWEKWSKQPNQAHNGYLETYLNLGLAGLLILFGLLVATYRKAAHELLANFQFGRFRMGFLGAVLVYNWTEASFKALHPVWFMFYIIAIDYPVASALAPERAARPPESTEQFTGVTSSSEMSDPLFPARPAN